MALAPEREISDELRRYLARAFDVAPPEIDRAESWYEPVRAEYVWRLDGRQVHVPDSILLRLDPPPQEDPWQMVRDIALTLHEARKERERRAR